MKLPPRWLVWAIAAVACWGIWAIISRLIGDALSAAQSQALSTIGLVPVLIALAFSGRLASHGRRGRGTVNALAAGVLTCGGNIAYYHALKVGGKAATVVPLTALYPLVTVMLAVLLLRERLNAIQLAGIVLSLCAIYLFNVTGVKDISSGWIGYALLPVALWGISGLLQKISTNDISGELSALWFLAAFVPVAVAILFWEPFPAALPVRVWILAAALGLFFSLGNFAILLAFANAGKASIIAPLAGLYPVVSIPIAILFLRERVGGREWAGILCALVAVAALACERPAKPATAVP